jgi:dTMP kinase
MKKIVNYRKTQIFDSKKYMQKNNFPGKFIVLEGLDGAGKSTQVSLILEHFKKSGGNAHHTSEPTQFLPGGLIRSRLMGEWHSSPECLQLLFAADRADHLEKEIAPMLKNGAHVVCDRYFMSSVVYGAIDSDFDWLAQINSRFPAPDLTIYLDVPVAVCLERIIDDGRSLELFEKSEILEKINKNYKMAIDRFSGDCRIAVINGNKNKDEVFGDIKKIIDNLTK